MIQTFWLVFTADQLGGDLFYVGIEFPLWDEERDKDKKETNTKDTQSQKTDKDKKQTKTKTLEAISSM